MRSICHDTAFIAGSSLICPLEVLFCGLLLYMLFAGLLPSVTVDPNVKYTLFHLVLNMAATQVLWCLRKLTHLVACVLDSDFLAFSTQSCGVLKGLTVIVVFAQLWLLLLVPAERLYAVRRAFGAAGRDPCRRVTITLVVLGIYSLLLPSFISSSMAKGEEEPEEGGGGQEDGADKPNAGQPPRQFINSTTKHQNVHVTSHAANNLARPLCLDLSSLKDSLVPNLIVSAIQTAIPLVSLAIALEVRRIGRQIYRSYVDRKSKLTVDERLEVEGVIRAARTVSTISLVTCLVFPYNFLLRLLASYVICPYDDPKASGVHQETQMMENNTSASVASSISEIDKSMRLALEEESGICQSITYALGYSVGRVATTAAVGLAIGWKTRTGLRRWMLKVLGDRRKKGGKTGTKSGSSKKCKMNLNKNKVTPSGACSTQQEEEEVDLKAVAREADIRFKQLQSQWGRPK